MQRIILDESSGNPFPPKVYLPERPSEVTPDLWEKALLISSFFPVSTEGYSHNDDSISETVKKLIDLAGLKPGQKTLDVGYGQNLTVAETMNRLGMQSYGIDSIDRPESQKQADLSFVPAKFNTNQNGVRKYWGTIEELLHPNSQLKDEKFDLITFWGSWESCGYNFAIGGEMGEFRVRQTRPDIARMIDERGHNQETSEILNSAMQDNRDKVLRDCVTALKPSGGILIVSSRYAGHGAGFSTDQLPWEKRINLRLTQSFTDLGASEVYLMGVSAPEVQRQLKPHQNFREVAEALSDDKKLFTLEREVYESRLSPGQLRKVIDMRVPLGRIDAVYGRFQVQPHH